MAAVALLTEGVDRNLSRSLIASNTGIVALLTEGVDRNGDGKNYGKTWDMSPSSRRAWIEISYYSP